MAKGKNDLILRDRMQFTFTGDDIPTLYGRVDLSDYVSIPKSEGLKIKEIRFQVRDTGTANTGSGGGGGGGGGSTGGAGGSGVVILRYPNDYTISLSGGATSSAGEQTDGTDKYIQIEASGNVSWA